MCCVLRILCTKLHGEFYFSTSILITLSQFGIEIPAQTGNTGHADTYPGENPVCDTYHRAERVKGKVITMVTKLMITIATE